MIMTRHYVGPSQHGIANECASTSIEADRSANGLSGDKVGAADEDDMAADLSAAAQAAHHALECCQPERQALLDTLGRFDTAVKAAEIGVDPNSAESIRDIVEAFRTKYDALRTTLDGLLDRTAANLSEAFADLERDSAFVTIMLFGRTRAGKSTTMEALTGGDGASIGIGKQDTTKDIQAYYYPRPLNGAKPNGPSLRIVDTPGIEGFQGGALAEMAERFIERSDHILFLLTDDKATADELNRFGTIRTQGKGITVLLNVKTKDEDLDLLVSKPSLVFRLKEIEGHKRRICGYLENHFAIPAPHIIPMHARAAWLSRSEKALPNGVGNRDILRERSLLADVERRIVDFIRHDALRARLCAPRDLLFGHLLPLKDELRPLAGEFRRMMGTIDQLVHRLQKGTERARVRVAGRFPLLRARFQAASDAIPRIVDEVIVAGGRGAALGSRWEALLREHGVADAIGWFVAAGQHDFREEVEAELQAASFDYEFAKADDFDEQLSKYYDAEEGEKRKKYARAGMRVAGGTGTALLAGWAIANFWNPTGWAAAAGLAVVAVAGVVGEELAHKATDEWERSSKKDMYEKRDEIVAKLRVRLWADYRDGRGRCGDWLDRTKRLQLDAVRDIAWPMQRASEQLWQAVVAALDRFDEVADRISAGLVRDLFSVTVPEVATGRIRVVAVVRSVGYRTKVKVVSTSEHSNPVAACVGHKGARIRKIRDSLGQEKIDLIDGGANLETQVLQALGLTRPERVSVTLNAQADRATAYLRLPTPPETRAAIGLRGMNLRLARQLTGINIVIMEN